MTLRTPENAARIVELIEDGCTVAKVCVEIGCSEAAIRRWSREDEEFGAQYAKARNVYNELQAEEIVTLADAARVDDPALINAYRLAIDTRKWVLSKVLPKKYGEKLNLNHGGQDGDNPVRITYGWEE